MMIRKTAIYFGLRMTEYSVASKTSWDNSLSTWIVALALDGGVLILPIGLRQTIDKTRFVEAAEDSIVNQIFHFKLFDARIA